MYISLCVFTIYFVLSFMEEIKYQSTYIALIVHFYTNNNTNTGRGVPALRRKIQTKAEEKKNNAR